MYRSRRPLEAMRGWIEPTTNSNSGTATARARKFTNGQTVCDGKGATTTSSSGRAARDLEAHVATRAHDGHDRGTFMKAVRRGRQYIFTHSGTTEKRFMYIKKLAQPQEGGANPCLSMSSSEYAGEEVYQRPNRSPVNTSQSTSTHWWVCVWRGCVCVLCGCGCCAGGW